ncbi:type II toxin-antitoxin system Phd/YefM family antitoxin [Ekhidna sp.]|uniref:type II toxin-antitoxin system Phd/YefM family antitoxin n=1 Tax=Ekhidna sp. TaxID=2608089 RepID=UPI003B504852
MEITTYSNFRQNLKAFLDKVFDSKSPVFVTRSNGEDVVVLSKDEYEGMQETLHLLSSPKNAQRLKESIDEYNKGGGQEKELLEA